jgi:hypothetical protein
LCRINLFQKKEKQNGVVTIVLGEPSFCNVCMHYHVRNLENEQGSIVIGSG